MKRHRFGSQIMTAGIAAVVAVIASLTSVALASHQFPDVPDVGFHDQIDSIVDAGCATGFNDGTFRPQSGTKRGQFAFWLNNCGGRSGFSNAPVATEFGDGSFIPVARTNLTTGGAPGGVQWVLVIGTYMVDDDGSGCPCDLDARLTARRLGTASTEISDINTVSVSQGTGGDVDDSITVVHRFIASTAATYEIEMDARIGNAVSELAMSLEDTQLMAWTTPFGSTGGSGGAEPEEQGVPIQPTGDPNG